MKKVNFCFSEQQYYYGDEEDCETDVKEALKKFLKRTRDRERKKEIMVVLKKMKRVQQAIKRNIEILKNNMISESEIKSILHKSIHDWIKGEHSHFPYEKISSDIYYFMYYKNNYNNESDEEIREYRIKRLYSLKKYFKMDNKQ